MNIGNFDITTIKEQHTTHAIYIKRYLELNDRMRTNKARKMEFMSELQRQDRVATLEHILDLTQARLVIPLLVISAFVSIVLFCQRVDGAIDVSYWVCAAPILSGVGYTAGCLYVTKVIYKHQYKTSHLLRGLWTNFRGPVVYFFRKVCGESIQALYATAAVAVLCLLQVLLVAVKISSLTPDDVNAHLPWAVVFLPLWILFALFCAAPLFSRYRLDLPVFFLVAVFLWVPFLVFFVGLAVKLTGQEHDSRSRNIRLALIMMPFWVIEGAVLLSSLVFLVVGAYRYCSRGGCTDSVVGLTRLVVAGTGADSWSAWTSTTRCSASAGSRCCPSWPSSRCCPPGTTPRSRATATLPPPLPPRPSPRC